MPTIEVIVSIKVDGVEALGQPIHRRVVVDNTTGGFTFPMAITSGYETLPMVQVNAIDVIALSPDTDISIRLAAQASGGFTVHAGGLLLIIDGAMGSDKTTNVKINNNGVISTLRGVVGGE